MTALDDLIELGFQPITAWVMNGQRIRLESLKWTEKSGWLYAFVVNGEVKYIGLTDNILRSRMDNYRDTKHTQTTRLRENILRELSEGQSVQIFGLAGLSGEALANEEARLRAKYRPPWNRM